MCFFKPFSALLASSLQKVLKRSIYSNSAALEFFEKVVKSFKIDAPYCIIYSLHFQRIRPVCIFVQVVRNNMYHCPRSKELITKFFLER
jgi:hypothetical protein